MDLNEFLAWYRGFARDLLRWIGRENLFLGYMLAVAVGYVIGLPFTWAYVAFVWFLGIYLAVGSKLYFER